MRINITIPDDILKTIDDHCKKGGFTRSEFIRHLVRLKADYLEEPKTMGPIDELSPTVSPPWPIIGKGTIKIDKVIKQSKEGGRCKHGISVNGYCRRCVEG